MVAHRDQSGFENDLKLSQRSFRSFLRRSDRQPTARRSTMSSRIVCGGGFRQRPGMRHRSQVCGCRSWRGVGNDGPASPRVPLPLIAVLMQLGRCGREQVDCHHPGQRDRLLRTFAALWLNVTGDLVHCDAAWFPAGAKTRRDSREFVANV